MNIFVSWAGRESQSIALILRDRLPRVLPYVQPWVSTVDIRKGTRWDQELWSRLQATSYAIICATPDAVRSPWVNFEAGVVARAVGVESHVSPVLFGMPPNAVGGLPLGKFQCTEFTEIDIGRLLKAINISAGEPIPESEIAQRFRRWWVSLRDDIGGIDLVDADEPEEQDDFENETVDYWLEETEEKVLEAVAWEGVGISSAERRHLELSHIAGQIGENHVRTRHYVDGLVDRGFLREKHNNAGPTTYVVTKKGRAYAVDNNLV